MHKKFKDQKVTGAYEQNILLEVQNLSIERDEKIILKSLDFSLKKGEILHIKGANASGKTSILKSILGILPSKGNIFYPNDKNSKSFFKNSIFIGHKSGLNQELSLKQSLELFLELSQNFLPNHNFLNKKIKNEQKNEQIEFILQKFDLHKAQNSLVSKLSAGQEKRLSLTRLEIFKKSIWLLDEAFSNLDKKGKKLLLEMIEKHRQNQGALILTSHTDLEFENLKILDLNKLSPQVGG